MVKERRFAQLPPLPPLPRSARSVTVIENSAFCCAALRKKPSCRAAARAQASASYSGGTVGAVRQLCAAWPRGLLTSFPQSSAHGCRPAY